MTDRTRPAPFSWQWAIRRGAALSCAAALVGVLLPAGASAHSQRLAISSKKVALRVAGKAKKRKFNFKAKDAAITTNIVNPIDHGSALLVVGEDGARTPLIELDGEKWKAKKGGKTYKYTDKKGRRGGVKSIVLKNGSLTIKAGGKNFEWSGATGLTSVSVLFRIEEEWLCAVTSGKMKKSGYTAKASSATACSEAICGDGETVSGESCDDGDLDDSNACKRTCQRQSTFDAIQAVIFDNPQYGCSSAVCHGGPNPAGGLDLSAGRSYEALLGASGLGALAVNALGTNVKLVEPSEPAASFLWHKLARKATPSGTGFSYVDSVTYIGGGSDMPSGTTVAVSDDHLHALWLWIRGGAPRDLVVEGTAELLGADLSDPQPLVVPIPDRPAAGRGVQFQQTPWPLPLGDEDEICMATYYDVSALVPEWAKVPCPVGYQVRKRCNDETANPCSDDTECGGAACVVVKNANNPGETCFAWRRQVLYQDPQSHHSLIHLYTGAYDASHPGWGAWTKKFQDADAPERGAACDPTAIDPALGYNPNCSSGIVRATGCVGFGPPDYTNLGDIGGIAGQGSGNSPLFSGSQEPYYEQGFAPGVYSVLPVRGIIVWNSHAFNFTPYEATLSQYLNLDFAEDQRFLVEQIFDASSIFVQDVPPYETREYCKTYTLPRGARLFQMSSHTHQWGVLFRVWGPPQTPCRPECPGTAGALSFLGLCDRDRRLPICGPPPDDPGKLVYRSTTYTDPLQLEWNDAPIEFDQPAVEDRTFLYCSKYDNGSTPESPAVKRRSTSPDVPPILGIPGLAPGGPCSDQEVACLDGPNKGQPCGGDDALCPGSVCDACPVVGGVTTTDEMFIFLGLIYRQ
jgi:hypothetical protein